MKKQDGFILLMVIAVLTAASAALAIASLSARLGAKEVGVTIDLAQARAASEAVLARSVLELNGTSPLYADGRPYHFAIHGINLTYWLVDTRGLIDLNGAKEKLLTAFFMQLGLNTPDAESMADTIADWRDKNDQERPRGAEARAYQNAGLPGPGNRRFIDVSELRGVLGMTAALYQAAAPYLTAGPGNSEPDPLSAPEPVLALLSLSATERDEILNRRRNASTPLSRDAFTDTKEKANADKAKTPEGRYLLMVEAELPSGTKQAMRLVFSTGPRPGEYAILSRRTLPFGEAAKIYETRAKDVNF
ncbi:MAG: type II secretion system protein GspK [Robiginitomaculum sp.]|nr:type II secretion system protein GspK [Robiginitomaculum sp.]MDQ7076306.1 type II secretion system protein GspK [Robiginitomaculum sp.]